MTAEVICMAKNNRSQKNKKNDKVRKATIAYNHSKAESIQSDVLGSYTGVPYSGDVPEQDADDL